MPDNRKIADEVRALLVEKFPLAFVPKGEPKRPLKIGIRDDLFAAMLGITKFKINVTLNDYCFGTHYADAAVEGAARVDLQGNPAGVVTAEEARHAARRSLGLTSQAKLERDFRALQRAAGHVVEVFSATPDVVITSLGPDVMAAVQATRDAHARSVAP